MIFNSYTDLHCYVSSLLESYDASQYEKTHDELEDAFADWISDYITYGEEISEENFTNAFYEADTELCIASHFGLDDDAFYMSPPTGSVATGREWRDNFKRFFENEGFELHQLDYAIASWYTGVFSEMTEEEKSDIFAAWEALGSPKLVQVERDEDGFWEEV